MRPVLNIQSLSSQSYVCFLVKDFSSHKQMENICLKMMFYRQLNSMNAYIVHVNNQSITLLPVSFWQFLAMNNLRRNSWPINIFKPRTKQIFLQLELFDVLLLTAMSPPGTGRNEAVWGQYRFSALQQPHGHIYSIH